MGGQTQEKKQKRSHNQGAARIEKKKKKEEVKGHHETEAHHEALTRRERRKKGTKGYAADAVGRKFARRWTKNESSRPRSCRALKKKRKRKKKKEKKKKCNNLTRRSSGVVGTAGPSQAGTGTEKSRPIRGKLTEQSIELQLGERNQLRQSRLTETRVS